jgi:lipoprotein-anchoring transpeptidase ErfK/SrfK
VVFKMPPPPPSSPTPAEEEPAGTPELKAREPAAEAPAATATPITNWLEAQIALAREGFSSGPIDGVGGAQSATALRAFQESRELPVTGALDPATRAKLVLASPPLTQMILTAEDLARLQPLEPTWLGKSQQTALEHETALELIAERTHASPNLIRQLNPEVDWAQPSAGTPLTVPAVGRLSKKKKAARIIVQLAAHTLEIFDADGGIVAHFPVSIASRVEKRPVGELHVTVVVANPDYTFNPEVFPESEEARTLGRKLVLPPGPNNPVGLAWVGLDLSGYGIHGTPKPEQVGRTESHGCFRLANWDALTLLDFASIGLPVVVEP